MMCSKSSGGREVRGREGERVGGGEPMEAADVVGADIVVASQDGLPSRSRMPPRAQTLKLSSCQR